MTSPPATGDERRARTAAGGRRRSAAAASTATRAPVGRDRAGRSSRRPASSASVRRSPRGDVDRHDDLAVRAVGRRRPARSATTVRPSGRDSASASHERVAGAGVWSVQVTAPSPSARSRRSSRRGLVRGRGRGPSSGPGSRCAGSPRRPASLRALRRFSSSSPVAAPGSVGASTATASAVAAVATPSMPPGRRADDAGLAAALRQQPQRRGRVVVGLLGVRVRAGGGEEQVAGGGERRRRARPCCCGSGGGRAARRPGRPPTPR